MPRPNAKWQRKYGKRAAVPQKEIRLSPEDDTYAAVLKLAAGVNEAASILFQALRYPGQTVMRLLDMDDMQMYGEKIVKAYHEWSCNDYAKLIRGVAERDPSLVTFLKGR